MTVNKLNELESLIFGYSCFDSGLEESVVVWLSELNKLATNYPLLNISNLISSSSNLIIAYNDLVRKSSILHTQFDDLKSEHLTLESKFNLEKDARRSVLNDSFKMQEECATESDSLHCKINSLNTSLKKSLDTHSNLSNENSSLHEQMSVLHTQVDSLKATISELRSCKTNLTDSLNSCIAEKNVMYEDKWLSDDIMQSFVQCCQYSISHKENIIIVSPSVCHLIKLSKSDDVALHNLI